MLISTAFRPLLLLREISEFIYSRTGDRGCLKQFAKSKHGLEFLGLCLQYFICASCLIVQGWYLQQEKIPQSTKGPCAVIAWLFGVCTPPFW